MPHFWLGILLLVLGHILIFARNGSGEHTRPWSDYWFAAIWFGYILVLDAVVYRRDGESLVVSRPRIFLAMLPLSAAAWWGFEWVNSFVRNWRYDRPTDIPDWWANLWSCIFFSTVIPAIWVTADWIGGWRIIRNLPRVRGFSVSTPLLLVLITLGLLFFILPAIWPLYFFPLIWGFVALILDPINYWRGSPSILRYWSKGDWRVPVALYLSGHVCGILWEFWNYWAFPKWHYDVPFVGFLKIFEMPLLGYLGYGPFALEIFTVFWFCAGLLPQSRNSRSLNGLEQSLVSE